MGIAIFLADDHEIVRVSLQSLLEKQPDIRVVGQAGDGRETVEKVRELKPNIVIMDVVMPNLNGIEATGRITRELPDVKVLALSMYSDRHYVLAMFHAGASGYLLKKCASRELVQAIRIVAANQFYLSPAISNVVVDELIDGRARKKMPFSSPLTAREREILQLLVEGKVAKEIAAQLYISLSTVETHRRQVMEKLDLHNIADLTKYAIREGITSLQS